MVKVLPNNFNLFESQRILSPTGEPLAITCSNDLLFIAVEECMIEAYDLCTLEQLAQFRTVSPVAQVAYNCVGDCIVTLERKATLSQGFVRVYFKWRGLSADKPMRILMASIQRSIPGQNRIAAEIVELPSDSGNSVSCLACCEYTGRIAVAMGSLLRVFYIDKDEQISHRGTSSSPCSFSHRSTSPTSPTSPLPISPPSPTPSIEILLDIQTNTPQLEMVSIMGDYIAFISTNEARVVKLSLFQSGNPIPDYKPQSTGNEKLKKEGVAVEEGESRGGIAKDKNFVLWSPSAVWEAEKSASYNSTECSTQETVCATTNHSLSYDTRDHMMSGDDHMTPRPGSPVPAIGTLSLKSIMEMTSEKLSDRETMEVLGPVEYVWGQPLFVSVNHTTQRGNQLAPLDCRALTMLYRRFSAKVAGSGRPGVVSQLMGLSHTRRVTLPVRVQSSGVGLGAEGGWDGLHTIQLIPTFAKNSGSASEPPQLVGISCFLANRFHSYLYDVHQKCRLLSSFSFMEKSCLASCDGMLLHALSSDSVETYTSRAFQAAIGNLSRSSAVVPSLAEGENWAEFGEQGSVTRDGVEVEGRREGEGEGEEGGEGESKMDTSLGRAYENGVLNDASGPNSEERKQDRPDPKTWLRQPIPPHNLDLTLVATSKFVGCCYLATSQDYIVVVTKGEADSQSPTGTSWLIQSLTLRKAKAEQMWNIYVLKLRSATSLFKQFMDFAESMRDTSPPTRQHLLSEGHVLLRREILQDSSTEQTLRWLQENCFQLADSLCHYSRWNGIETHASHYFIMSGRPVVDVVRHMLSNYKPDHKTAYSVLTAYLNLVLFEEQNAEKHMPLLQPLVDKVLDLYANHNSASHMRGGSDHMTSHVTSHVIPLLHDSWLSGYSSENALSLLETQMEATTEEKENSPGRMCHAMLCLRLGREQDARHTVSQMPKETLQKWMTDNPKFVMDLSTLTFTPLGEMVVKVQETCILEILVAKLKTGNMTFDDLCTLLKNGDRQNLAYNVALKHFVEMTILDRSEVISMATTTKAVLILVEILLARLSIGDIIPKSSKSMPFLGSRYKWLDSVAPFGDGEEEDGVAGSTAPTEEGKKRRLVHHRLHNLMQLQTLLCSCHMTEAVATRVEELLTQTQTAGGGGGEGEGEGEGERGGENGLSSCILSLRMISWPHMGRKREACQLCLDNCPLVIIDYCQTLFPNDLDLWVWLLEQLLGYTEWEGDPPPLQEVYVSLYKEALSHIVTLTTPQQFLSLLPPSGSVDFFLPFIERSCKLHYSDITSERLHSSLLEQ